MGPAPRRQSSYRYALKTTDGELLVYDIAFTDNRRSPVPAATSSARGGDAAVKGSPTARPSAVCSGPTDTGRCRCPAQGSADPHY